jgi:hypothetical protein
MMMEVPPPPTDMLLLLALTVVELTLLLFLQEQEGPARVGFRDDDPVDEAVETEDASLKSRLLLIRLRLRILTVEL